MVPLSGLRVVDLTVGIAGPLCAKLLADAGASVTRVEIEGRDGPVGRPAASWLTFLHLDKKTFAVDPSSEVSLQKVDDLLADSDVYLNSYLHEELAEFHLDCPSVSSRHPQLITACVTPFGQSGPYSRLRADDVVVSALSGLADATPGFPDRRDHQDDPPLQSLAPLAETSGGLAAAIGLLGAVHERLADRPEPRHVEVSTLEATVSMMVFEWGITAYGGGLRGRRPGHADVEPNCYLPCRDGDVIIPAFTEAHWNALVDMMGQPDWASDEMFGDVERRTKHWRELRAHLGRWAREHDGLEILHAAQARGLPCCPALELTDTLTSDHIRSTAALRTRNGVTLPADPIIVDGHRRTSVPSRASDDVGRLFDDAPAAMSNGSPLSGIRVLDLSQYVAGPFAGQMLASLGAEVVLVESGTHLVTRKIPPFVGEPTYDASMNFNYVNRGKKSVLINLRSPEGRQMLDRLVASSDVVLENFSRRAVERLGLTYDALSSIREDIIVASISGFGRTGPWGGYVALHSGVILMSGLASVTRDENHRPRLVGAIYPDLMTGAYLTLAVQQALINRQRTGDGCQIELSMLDVVLGSMGGLVSAAATGETFEAHPASFLRTKDTDRFVAVSEGVANELREEVQRLSREEAMDLLQSRGLSAGAVLDISEVMVNPHLTARNFVVQDNHPLAKGRPAPGVPWLYNGERPTVDHAPLLGDSTDEVLGRVAGVGRNEIETLRTEGALV